MAKKSTGSVARKTLVIGAGLAAATIAATLLFGKNGKKNRKGLKDWSLKMRDEVMEKAHELKVVSAPVYAEIIDSVAKKYATVKEISHEELEREIKRLKKEWQDAVGKPKKLTAMMLKRW
jgi:gas vesicle protein